MFTGIISHLGVIKKREDNLFTIQHTFEKPLEKGESVALSGTCCTVVDFDDTTFTVEIMAESRKVTIFGDAQEGDKINLERAAKNGERNSGHFVLGHVDEVGTILSRKRVDDFELFRIGISEKNAELCVYKGSIAIDGISLTISNLGKNWIEVSIISHTLEHTNLSEKKENDRVNLEFDILGKYILRREALKD